MSDPNQASRFERWNKTNQTVTSTESWAGRLTVAAIEHMLLQDSVKRLDRKSTRLNSSHPV